LLTVLLNTLALPHVRFVNKCDWRSLQEDEQSSGHSAT